MNLVLAMYTECRKVIDSTQIEGWGKNSYIRSRMFQISL